MKWISVKDQLPGTDIALKSIFIVYKIGNACPDIAWFIPHDKGYSFTIGNDVGQTYEPDFWFAFSLPNQPERSKREDFVPRIFSNCSCFEGSKGFEKHLRCTNDSHKDAVLGTRRITS